MHVHFADFDMDNSACARRIAFWFPMRRLHWDMWACMRLLKLRLISMTVWNWDSCKTYPDAGTKIITNG